MGAKGATLERPRTQIEASAQRSTPADDRDAIVVGYVRTPFGRYGGVLAHVRPDDLAAHVIRGVVERSGVAPVEVDEVIFGASNQAGEDNRNVARMAALLAGLPAETPGVTVNLVC